MEDDPKKPGRKRFEQKGARPGRPAGKAGMRGNEKAGSGGKGRPSPRSIEQAEKGAGERIAKRLARAGIASRRDAEDLIAAGRVSVNGKKLDSPAFNVMPDDTIAVDGTAIPPIERTRLFLFHKPAGVVTTNRDPEGRTTVFDTLPPDLPRLMTVGRLDINTEGLLLLTNDGGLARVLELPSTGWLRRYRVRVHGRVDEQALSGLREGTAVDGVFYGSVEASLDREQGSNAWLTIGLREGKNREVKNILGALGLEVSRLIRVSYGPFQLGDLPERHVQEIRGRLLRDQLGERLIEEAGANFEAPVLAQFSNKPVRRAARPLDEQPSRPQVRRDGERGRIREGGLIKGKRRREDVRDEALGKLSTRRPERGPGADERPRRDRDRKPGWNAGPERRRGTTDAGGRRERPPIEPPGGRKANVWMAPGARPIGAGRAAAEKAEADAARKARAAKGSPHSAGDRAREGRGPRPGSDTAPGEGRPAAEGKRDRRSDPGRRAPASPRRPGSGKGPARPPRGKGPGGGPRRK